MMKNTVLLLVSVMLFFLSAFSAHAQEAVEGPTILLVKTPRQKIADFQRDLLSIKRAGLSKDRSRIPLLIERLDTKDADKEEVLASYADVLQALGRIGAVEALPIIESIRIDAATVSEPRPVLYSKVVRARLIAERSARLADATLKNNVLITMYLRELGLTAAQLSERRANQDMHLEGEALYKVQALRELADIAYHSRNTSLVREAQNQGINFSVDDAANLKIVLLPMTMEERVIALIENLSTIKVINDSARYATQLAVDEGAIASQAAAIKIPQVLPLVERGERTNAAVVSLIEVIRGVGDKRQVPLLNLLKQSKNKWVVHSATINFPAISRGETFRYVSAY